MTDIPLAQLPFRDPGCTRCDLHKVNTVCIPTDWYGNTCWPTVETRKHKRALLVVGEAPGANEDKEGRNFVGKAGKHLRNAYIDFYRFPDKVDVFLANAARCRPPQNTTPTKTQLKSCQGFLIQDLKALQEIYDEVIILAVGGTAVLSVTGDSMGVRFKKQGQESNFQKLTSGTWKSSGPVLTGLIGEVFPPNVKVFVTYHPSYLGRNPSAGLAVLSHLRMLNDYLEGRAATLIKPRELEIAIAPPPPTYPIKRLSLDIETYGFFQDGPDQTQFHPLKMERYDNVEKSRIIRITGLSWRDPDGGLHHAVFNMEEPGHRRTLWSWFGHIRRHRQDFEFLVGQNITFDLMCLRHCYPDCRAWLNHNLPIWDTLITNYLHDEGKPEKSMKALAPLLGITEYEDKPVKAYRDANDPTSHQYVCQDTASTLCVHEKLEGDIRKFYGPKSQKLSPFCYEWYSDLLWLIIWMTETGIAMDVTKLKDLFTRYMARRERIKRAALSMWQIPLQGKGSEVAKRAIMEEAIEFIPAYGGKVPDLKLTEKTHKVAFKVENRNLLLDTLHGMVLGETPVVQRKLELIGRYQDVSKLLDSYLYPLLVGRGKKHDDFSTRIVDSIAYPRWYPVPSEFDDNTTGGTRQARIVCKGPAAQTFPAIIKSAITTRFDGLIWFDYSQIELRVAALLSDDPAMSAEYRKGKPDLHGNTAKLMFGDEYDQVTKKPDKMRQGGKTFNFRGLFRGGAEKAQNTLMQDLGIWLPLSRIQEIDNAFWARHHRLWEWQEEMIAFVRKHDFFELPLIGQSRLFLGGRKAKDKAVNEIVNLPVQAVAADIMLSAQYTLWRAFKDAHLRSVVPINVYDAADIEAIKTEQYAIRRIMAEVLPNPPFYAKLCQQLGRTLPLEYEVKEKWN